MLDDRLDMNRLGLLKKFGWLALALLAVFISYAVGTRNSTVKQATNKPKVVKEKTVKTLAQKDVEEFLVAYYTKKDLEENRNRYKPLMTSSLYQQEIDLESQALNQAYKGYIVDFQFQDADIYIDTERLIALVKVRYTNTLLELKNNYDKSQKVTNEVSLQLTFVDQGGKYLLNQKTPITLTTVYNAEPDYPDYGTLETEEKSNDDKNIDKSVTEHGNAPEEAETSSTEEKEEDNGQETQAD